MASEHSDSDNGKSIFVGSYTSAKIALAEPETCHSIIIAMYHVLDDAA